MVSKFKQKIEKHNAGFTKQVHTFLFTIGQQRAHRNLTFWQEMCPQYMNKIYKTANQNNTVTRNSSLKLFQPLRAKSVS